MSGWANHIDPVKVTRQPMYSMLVRHCHPLSYMRLNPDARRPGVDTDAAPAPLGEAGQ